MSYHACGVARLMTRLGVVTSLVAGNFVDGGIARLEGDATTPPPGPGTLRPTGFLPDDNDAKRAACQEEV